MEISAAWEFLPRTPTVRAAEVMDHFGIGLSQDRLVLADRLELPIRPGHVVLFSGPSGSGKSTLLRETAARLSAAGTSGEGPANVLTLDDLSLPDQLLIDALPGTAAEAMQLLSQCGLAEPRLMLRTPAELSDGQRFRFRVALAVAQRPAWVLADEFTATLDRTLAKVLSFNVRRLADRTGIGFLAATTHEDVADDLQPDLHVRCELDRPVTVGTRGAESPDAAPPEANRGPQKKRRGTSASRGICGSAPRPEPTGRTSLGGITAATMSG
ncbi:MAG: hypothetical protein KF774_10905 [Planctomyces sp.]|nr:hypothetical protein [Planctomyces sp.]